MTVDVRRALEIGARAARARDDLDVVLAGSDPAVERHSAELFGVETVPDFSPPGTRYVPPKTALVEWVGEPSPFDSEMVRALRLRGLLTPIHRLVLEMEALLRRARVDGHTSWTLGPRDGLSKTYRWGAKPGTYVQEVAFADVDRLLEIGRLGICRDLNQFRVVGSHADALPPQRADAAWAKVIARISRKEGLAPLPPGAERLRIRSGPEEALVGIDRSGLNGYWRS
jgi:hypothetical protein